MSDERCAQPRLPTDACRAMPSNPIKSKFRLGLLLDSPTATKYVVEFVKRCQANADIEISQVLVLPPERSPQDANPSNSTATRKPPALSTIFFKLVIAIEKLLILKNERHYAHCRQFDLSPLLSSTQLTQLPENDGLYTIQALELDLLIALSSDARSSERFRDCARLGTIALSYSHDFTDQSRLAGFWEAYFHCETTGFLIDHQAPGSASRDVLMRGRVGTAVLLHAQSGGLVRKIALLPIHAR